MRKLGGLLFISLVSIILLPAITAVFLNNNQQMEVYSAMSQGEEQVEEGALVQEQLIGILAKEIPIGYELEAIKAQAIIARSNKEPNLYMSTEEMKQLWGGDYSRNYTKLKRAVDETAGKVITYEGEKVQGMYHLQNAGVTQSSYDIWGVESPYLQAVESLWDKDSGDLVKEKIYSLDEVINKLTQGNPTLELEAYQLENQIQIIERTRGGYVKSVQVGNEQMSGDTFRRLLGLRSSCFAMTYTGNKVTFITKGAGHGVGLSQYGANEMAREGKGYEEILKYYFKGIEIE